MKLQVRKKLRRSVKIRHDCQVPVIAGRWEVEAGKSSSDSGSWSLLVIHSLTTAAAVSKTKRKQTNKHDNKQKQIILKKKCTAVGCLPSLPVTAAAGAATCESSESLHTAAGRDLKEKKLKTGGRCFFWSAKIKLPKYRGGHKKRNRKMFGVLHSRSPATCSSVVTHSMLLVHVVYL